MLSCLKMRLALGALVPLALAAVTLPVAASAGPATGKPPVPAPADVPVRADRDNDKVFENLEARLARMQPGEKLSVLVKTESPASAARVDELAKKVGKFDTGRRFGIVNGFSATVTKGQVEALSHVPWVVHVEENSTVRAFNASAQASFGVTKARTDAPALDGNGDGAASYSPADLVAAVIDTGIDANHVELDGGKVLAFKDFVNGRTAPYDDNGHGTHVAGTIAGDGAHAGVAPAAGLVGVKVLDASGAGTMDAIVAAIDWVVANKSTYGIEAINLSLGASGCANGTDVTSQAVDRAVAAGLVVAVAAGNEGAGTCTIGAPGAAAQALTVGAMADTGVKGFSLAPFSSRGKTADGRIKPDVVAPGVDIVSASANTSTGYVAYSGTSMATPFAAGVALLMLDANPALTPQQVKAKLVETAIDWGRTGADGEYGAGRLDAYAALTGAGAPLSAPPAAPRHELREGSLSGSGAVVDYKLNVDDLRFPLAATLIIPGITGAAAGNPDFDLYLYGPTGALVAYSEDVTRQEQLGYMPTATGTYTLRVSSYAGSGAYYVDLSGGFTVAASAPVTVTASPAATSIYAGTLRSGYASWLGAADGYAYSVNASGGASDWAGQIRAVPNALKSLRVTYRGRASLSCTQRVGVYNWTTSTWTWLDTRTIGTSWLEVSATPTGTLADYVGGTTGDGDVLVRIRCTRGDTYGYFTAGDLIRITYTK